MTTLASRALSSAPAFEPSFLEALAPALPLIAEHRIRVAVNAGGVDVRGCAGAVRKLVAERVGSGGLKVAWVEGDDVLGVVKERLGISGQTSDDFENLCTGERLRDWEFSDRIIGAQAYLGGLGIARAFDEGADIVVAGRVADASPVIGAAMWWHGWDREQLDELAFAFVAGHMIECSTYVCGGNFSGFKDMEGLEGGGWTDIGYPIAEIGRRGEVIITKQKATGGIVNEDTCKAQLLYEIQGPWYFNSDVTAILDEIAFEQLSANRVALHGVKAGPPPPTTKVGITAHGGFQAEVHWFLVGLDIKEKARMLEMQIRKALGDTSRFHVLRFTLNGTAAEDPVEQNAATVDFRVFAQAKEEKDIATNHFLRPIVDLIMCSYPGATFHLDLRQGMPKPVFEYFVTLLPQNDVEHVIHLHDERKLVIKPPSLTRTYPRQQPSQDSSIPMKSFGETVKGPLGWLVQARSGDKGSNANVGFWVRHGDEYDWLRTLLSIENVKYLLAKEYNGKKIVSCRYCAWQLLLIAVGSFRTAENLGRTLPSS
jgi:hypothetical protein